MCLYKKVCQVLKNGKLYCQCKHHPKYFNTGGGAYIDSKAYHSLKLDKPSYTDTFLLKDFSKAHVPSTLTSSSSSSVKQSNNAQAQKCQSKLLASLVYSECTLTSPDPMSHFVSFDVSRVLDQNIVQQRNKVRNRIWRS